MTESDLEQESDDLSKDAGSGIMRTLTSLETKVVHMTRSATARLDLFSQHLRNLYQWQKIKSGPEMSS